MYYSLYGNEMPYYDICFDEKLISNSKDVNKEIEKIFSYMINGLEKANISYDTCGIIPCVGLFVNEDDLKRLDSCKSLYHPGKK